MINKKEIKKENLWKIFFVRNNHCCYSFYNFFTYRIRMNLCLDEQECYISGLPEMDSAFVKDCYSKYKPQIKDDIAKAGNNEKFLQVYA